MLSGRCPKCASPYAEGAWICERCEWILDPSVLLPRESPAGDAPGVAGVDWQARDDGDDDVRTMPVIDAPDVAALLGADAQGTTGGKAAVAVADILGGDAVILGKLEDGESESFVSDRTGAFFVAIDVEEAPPPAPVYLSSELARLLQPEAIPCRAEDAGARRAFLRPIEGLVFDLVNGGRSVRELRGQTGMAENDLRVVLAILIEKAMIEVAAPAADLDFDAAAAGFDEHTSEIDELPPPVDAADAGASTVPLPRLATPAPTREHFDDLVMVPLPLPAPAPPDPPEPSPWARSSPPAPDPEGFAIPKSDEVASARPAMRVEPLRPRQRSTPMPPSSLKHGVEAPAGEEPERQLAYTPKAGLTVARKSAGAPAPTTASTSAPSKEAKARATHFYELCMKDLHEGRAGRAWGYAKMAADADPSDEKYRQLLAEWSKMVGGPSPSSSAAAGSAAGIKELFEASQMAEQAGDYETAVAHVRQLCELAPTSAAAFNRLSVLLATRLKDFKAAYTAATKAVELDGKNMTYQSNMMKILAKLDDVDEKPASGGRGGLVGKLLGK